MRALVSRGLLVPPLLCAALVFGPAGTAAAVGDAGREAPGVSVAEAAPRADAGTDTLLDSLLTEGLTETLSEPLTEAHGNRMDPAAAAAYAEELRAWNATVQERLRSVESDRSAASAAADPVADLLASIQKAVDDLLSSLTSLDLGGVLSAVTGLLGSLVGAVTGLLGNLPELPLPTS